jgi:hypothetical protein
VFVFVCGGGAHVGEGGREKITLLVCTHE